MGLRSTVDKAVATVFQSLGDLAMTVTYNSITIGDYEATAGETDTAPVPYAVKGILDNYRIREIDGEAIKPGDQMLIVRQSTLPVAPQLTDTVSINGQLWAIISISQDAAGATWTFQVRRA